MIKGTNHKEMMHIKNYQRILQLLAIESTSRVGLAKLTGLTKAAVGNITNQMLSDGIIQETGNDEEDTGVGRKPILLSIKADWAYIGCISIDRQEIASGITDLQGNIVGTPFYHAYFADAEGTVDLLCRELEKQIQALPAGSRIVGVGVIAPGPLDSASGVILKPPGFGIWEHFPIKEAIMRRFPYPVFAEHNSTAITRAEKLQMPSAEYRNFAVYFINEGIGLGLVLDHKIFTGPEGGGCEIGHTSIDLNGRICNCGNRGCLELYASVRAVLHDIARVEPSIHTWSQVVDRAIDNSDRLCNAFLEMQADCLAQSMLNLYNLLALDAVIVAGEAAYRGEFLCQKIARCIGERQMDALSPLQVKLSRLKEHAAIKGAGAVVSNQFYYHDLFLQNGLSI